MKDGQKTDLTILRLAQVIMAAVVWEGAKDHPIPIDGEKASMAFAIAAISAISKKSYWISPKIISPFDQTKNHLGLLNCALRQVLNLSDREFADVLLFLFEPRSFGDIRDSGISTNFAQWWGFGLTGHQYPDTQTQKPAWVRREMLDRGQKKFAELSKDRQLLIRAIGEKVPSAIESIFNLK